ncbi:MAG: hypothetical protein QM811_16750 [Pirellulales bacterium]
MLFGLLLGAIGIYSVPREAQDTQFGYVPNPAATEAFLLTLPNPELLQAAPQLFAARDGQDVFLYRSLYKAYKASKLVEWIVGAQGIGDCVSWGWAHAIMIHMAVLWELGETSEWREAATESIYGGSRVEALGRRSGGYGDGSYGGAAAKWVKNFGVIFRQDYPDLGVDLTKYSSKRAKDWGNYGNGGKADGGRLDAEAKKHPVLDVALVTTFDQAAAAIANGYPVPVCSSVGFTSTRDAQGFLRRGIKPWAHCMCFVGVRYGDRPGLLCLNSWGPKWVSGPKYPDDQPDGSFWVDKDLVNVMLAGRDSFAVSGLVGFPRNDLSHGDWVNVAPPREIDTRETEFALAP